MMIYMYVRVLGKDLLNHPAKNLLFINQHDLTFKEEAEEYGLAFTGYSTQAVFLDYDKDGDLDMFLVNYLLGMTAYYAYNYATRQGAEAGSLQPMINYSMK